MSAASGGGIRDSIHRQRASGSRKSSPAALGIQNSRDAQREQPAADRLRHAVGENEARAQAGGQGLGQLPAFEKSQHHAKDHPQGQAISEQAGCVPGRRHQAKADERRFGQGDEQQRCRPRAARAAFRRSP